jgi:hypothetical protein
MQQEFPMANTDKINVNDTQWAACAKGTLRAFSSREQSRRFRRKSYVVGGVLASCCLLALAVRLFPSADLGPLPAPSHVASESSLFGGMYCSEVLGQMDRYLAGEMQDAELGPVKRHLQDCEKCRVVYQRAAAERGVTLTQQEQAELEAQTVSLPNSIEITNSIGLAMAAN